MPRTNTSDSQFPSSLTLVGKAQVLPAGAKEWRDLQVKTIVNEKDRIRTAKGAKLTIVYKKSQIRLGGETDLVIASLAGNKSPTKVDLKSGFSWFSVKGGQPFQVTTPTSLAGVRGTKFAMASDDSGSISCVCEGVVETALLSKSTLKKEAKQGDSHSFTADGRVLLKDFGKYFRKLKADRSFGREIEKDKKLAGCTNCHRMTNLSKDKSADDTSRY